MLALRRGCGNGHGRMLLQCCRYYRKSTDDIFSEDLLSFIRRRKLYFKAKMTTKKKMTITLWSGQVVNTPAFSWSDVAGHGSFVFLALSYLESDFLSLRCYALSGITLSLLFQYYREIPLWIPIRWNAFFLLINSVMIALLLKEQNDAYNLTDDELHLYSTVFKKKNMNRVDFLHLMHLAQRQVVSQGDLLVAEGQVSDNNKVAFYHLETLFNKFSLLLY
jgi:hypothetical protein